MDDLATNAGEMLGFMGSTAMDGYDRLKESSDAYVEHVLQLGKMIQGFSAVGNDIYANVEHMKGTTDAINHTIEETAADLHNIALRFASMSESMKRIEEQAKASSSVSDALYHEVDKFKVE